MAAATATANAAANAMATAAKTAGRQIARANPASAAASSASASAASGQAKGALLRGSLADFFAVVDVSRLNLDVLVHRGFPAHPFGATASLSQVDRPAIPVYTVDSDFREPLGFLESAFDVGIGLLPRVLRHYADEFRHAFARRRRQGDAAGRRATGSLVPMWSDLSSNLFIVFTFALVIATVVGTGILLAPNRAYPL